MTQADLIKKAVSDFGASAKAKLGEGGQPEDQLRNPLEQLFAALSLEIGLPKGALTLIGEKSLSELRTRPDFAVNVQKALIGFIEVKAPGKGADPRKWKAGHDKDQWDKLKALPNLLYTDGNAFSLWRDGALIGTIIKLDGDIELAGAKLAAPDGFLPLIHDFLSWQPIAPRNVPELARISARLCRFLRDEVIEQLGIKNAKLSELKDDWKALLFPDADDAKFADGYAQAVTFGLLMAKSKGLSLADGLDEIAKELGKTNTLIGAAPADRAGSQTWPRARHVDARARCGRLGCHRQRRSRSLALFLREFPRGLRQQAAQADRQLLHPARSGSGDGAALR